MHHDRTDQLNDRSDIATKHIFFSHIFKRNSYFGISEEGQRLSIKHNIWWMRIPSSRKNPNAKNIAEIVSPVFFFSAKATFAFPKQISSRATRAEPSSKQVSR